MANKLYLAHSKTFDPAAEYFVLATTKDISEAIVFNENGWDAKVEDQILNEFALLSDKVAGVEDIEAAYEAAMGRPLFPNPDNIVYTHDEEAFTLVQDKRITDQLAKMGFDCARVNIPITNYESMLSWSGTRRPTA